MSDEDLVRAQGVPVGAVGGWLGNPLPARVLHSIFRPYWEPPAAGVSLPVKFPSHSLWTS
jgi:hypothetical protein